MLHSKKIYKELIEVGFFQNATSSDWAIQNTLFASFAHP